MAEKILIPLYRSEVAPRFDLAAEVVLVTVGEGLEKRDEKMIMLPGASAENLCHMILSEKVHTVICGGIEEEYHQYLTWKKVRVIDAVAGDWKTALERHARGRLLDGEILFDRKGRGI